MRTEAVMDIRERERIQRLENEFSLREGELDFYVRCYRDALERIDRIATGEDQVAVDDTEGMGVIHQIAWAVLHGEDHETRQA